MLLSSWALLTMEEKIISVEEKIIWEGLKKIKEKSVLSERMTVKNSTLLLAFTAVSRFNNRISRTRLLNEATFVLSASNMVGGSSIKRLQT